MANELYLHYEALDAAGKRFSELADDLEGHLPVWGCETGIVDITPAIAAINETAGGLADHLRTLSTIVVEVKNEVRTVDENQQLRYPSPFGGGPYYTPTFPTTPVLPEPMPYYPGDDPAQPVPPLGTVPPSYVNGLGDDQRLDLPDELTPLGPYAPGKDPR